MWLLERRFYMYNFDEQPGVLIESPAYVTCRVPNWRVLTKEPEDLTKSPLIPDKAIWKII